MTGRPWYPFFPDAYERDAGHLTYVQDSAYRRLLDHYYKTGEPLPLDKETIYRACRAMRREERAAIDHCLGQFFVLGDDGYHQTRADAEIVKAADISARRSEAANKRHKSNAKAPANADANAHAIAEDLHGDLHTHSTATSTATKKDTSLRSGVSKPSKQKGQEPEGFTEFYDAFPLKKGRQAAASAYSAALKLTTGEALLSAARRYATERKGENPKYTKWPQGWLSEGRWKDYAAPVMDLLSASAEAVNDPRVPNPGENPDHFKVRRFKGTGIWVSLDGPPPTDPDCGMPHAILVEFGYRNASRETAEGKQAA